MISRRILVSFFCALSVATFGYGQSHAQNAKPVTVFAAASLTNSLKEVGKNYTQETGVPVAFSFASSSILAKQIEAGAKADLILTADTDWMDYLEARNLIQNNTRANLVGGHLVLIAPAKTNVNLKIGPNFPIADYLGAKGKLATGDPDYVPAGKYARSSLLSLGVWNSIAPKVVRADNVRVVLSYVARGEAKLGIVYETDAKIEKNVKIIGYFPDNIHKPILYPVAITSRGSQNSNSFYQYVKSPKSMAVLARYGFTVPAITTK